MKRLFFTFLLFIAIFSYSQNATKHFSYGVINKIGYSKAVNEKNSILNQQINDNAFVDQGFAIYYTRQLFKVDSSNRIGGFLRVELGKETQAGVFEGSNNTIAKIKSSAINLNVLIKLITTAGENARIYGALGPNVGYIYRSEIVPSIASTQFPKNSNLVLGLTTEVGLMFGTNSFVGIRSSNEFTGERKHLSNLLIFGFSPQFPKRK